LHITKARARDEPPSIPGYEAVVRSGEDTKSTVGIVKQCQVCRL